MASDSQWFNVDGTEAEQCASACLMLPDDLRFCVNDSIVGDTCGVQESIPVENGLLIALCVLSGVYILVAMGAHLYVLRRKGKAKKEEKDRLKSFNSTAQFYRYEPHRTTLPNPNVVSGQLYPDAHAFDQDEMGEPASVSYTHLTLPTKA